MRLLPLLLILLSTPALAQDGAVVKKYDRSMGTLVISVPAGETVQARDVYSIVRDGKVLGDCMVISVKGRDATLIPMASFKGTPRQGDAARFVRHADAPADDTAGWVEFKAPDFSVMVPHAMTGPKVTTRTTSSGPLTIQEYQAIDATQGMVYEVLFARYTLTRAGAGERYLADEEQLEHFIDNMVKSTGGTLLWKRALKISDCPAREYELTLPKDDGITAKGRIVMVGTHVLWATAYASKSGTSSNALKFLNSLRLLKN